jgi:hypothetical protein
MNVEMERGGDRGQKTRLRLYWALSVFASIVFLMFIYVMSMVPGVPSVQKLWMLSVSGSLSAVSLGVGMWKFRTTEAPTLARPIETVVGVLLLLELTVCIIGIFQVSLSTTIP